MKKLLLLVFVWYVSAHAKSMKEKLSIGGKGFSIYKAMLEDIIIHIVDLKNDIRVLR